MQAEGTRIAEEILLTIEINPDDPELLSALKQYPDSKTPKETVYPTILQGENVDGRTLLKDLKEQGYVLQGTGWKNHVTRSDRTVCLVILRFTRGSVDAVGPEILTLIGHHLPGKRYHRIYVNRNSHNDVIDFVGPTKMGVQQNLRVGSDGFFLEAKSVTKARLAQERRIAKAAERESVQRVEG